MQITIRKALMSDSVILTKISFAAKRVWNYPEAYFDIWRDELTISPEYLQHNTVYLAEVNDEIAGYYSIVHKKQDFHSGQVFVAAGYWLEHIFIKPSHIGQGIGSVLMGHARQVCIESEIDKLFIFSDPNSKGFYDKIGASFVGESPSNIEGRTVSLYELKIF